MSQDNLRSRIYQTILDLASEDGINASAKHEVYGCIFGRDSAITVLKILKSTSNASASYLKIEKLHDICRRTLLTLVSLQGKEINVESGEEPGKFIHEYRKSNLERVLSLTKQAWYVYPDGILRNYDSLDSTPLCLIAIYKYWQRTQDNEFLIKVLPAVELGLRWLIDYADRDNDTLVEYDFPNTRKYGGLVVQSWTDSSESILDEDGRFPPYPIAPVEVQGYTWLALRLWSDFFANEVLQFTKNESLAKKLFYQANSLKKKFNDLFLFRDSDMFFPSQALDGNKSQIQRITGNPLLLLWATYKKNGKVESILSNEYIHDLVRRSFQSDMFDKGAGIRTMSTKSPTFNASRNSYHNGSFWPKLNGMSHEGLLNWGYTAEAEALKDATLKPILYFGTPVELYITGEDGTYFLYTDSSGQQSCLQQAWSAASILDLLTL